MEYFQKSQDNPTTKRLFLIHQKDKKQAINPTGNCGGDSPNSFSFIFSNPVKAFLNIDVLKKHKTINDGYLFSPLQLAPIVEATVQLEDLLLLIGEIIETNASSLVQQTITNYKNKRFFLIANPTLTVAEQNEKQALLKEKPDVPYISFSNKYLFRKDAPAANPLIFIKDSNAVIRGKIPMPTESKDDTLLDAWKKYPNIFWDFKATLEQSNHFFQLKLPLTQEDYDSFAIRSQVRARYYCLHTRTVPLIIKLCENTRRLLFDTLIQNHWKDIGLTPQKARASLKKDHQQIYLLAQRHRYIEDAHFLTFLEKQRNTVAHPNPFEGGNLFSNPYGIADFFWRFLCNHSDLDQLSFYSKYNPIAMNTAVLNTLENDFHVLRSDEMCLAYAKHKTQTNSADNNKRILASIKNDPLFKNDSNPIDNHQMRLGVAHGQPKKIASANIKENTLIQMQQEILFPENKY